jgi:phosphomannomutase
VNNTIKFGTDGWRGIIAKDFTFDNVRLCAQATADYLKKINLSSRGIVIGYDTRFASEDFAQATAEVMAANGIGVYFSDKAVPTPVVSYSVLHNKTSGAIAITASHNPSRWNGFKVKSSDGASAPTEAIASIESRLSKLDYGDIKQMDFKNATKKRLVNLNNLQPAYEEHINGLIDLKMLRRAGLRIAIDSMHGAGAGYLNQFLGGNANIIKEIRFEANPAFPGMRQPEPIAPNLKELSDMIRLGDFNVGLATDGDGDRLGILDEKGYFLTQLQVYALLAFYFLEVRGERGAIIKTITSTSMLYRLGKLYDVPVIETPVGFKHVAPLMLRDDALIGGEESGGYGFRGHIPERDAIIAALYFLDFMIRTNKKPSELLNWLYSKVGEHYYNRIDIEFDAKHKQLIFDKITGFKPSNLNGKGVTKIDTWDGYRYTLVDESWLLIRFSGTEPLLRLYAEGRNEADVNRLLEEGCHIAGVIIDKSR